MIQLIKRFINMMAIEKQDVYMVWSKSEKIGQIVQVDESKTEKKWLYFTDGSRINKSLVDEFMLRVPSLEEAERISSTLSNSNNMSVQPPLSRPVVQKEASSTSIKEEPKTPEFNVMLEMLRKMSVKNSAEIGVHVNVPSREVYGMLIEQMDVTNDDLNSHISLLIEDQIDSMRDQIKGQIEEFITNYYTK